MADFLISKNPFNRFEIETINDQEFDKSGKKVTGIAGYHGPLANIIGWIFEKIFHKTVAVSGKDGTYYFNCKSLAKFLNRVDAEHYKDLEKIALEARNTLWTENAIRSVLEAKQKKVPTKEEILAHRSQETNIETKENETLKEALFRTVKEGKVEEFDKLLQQEGADLNIRNADGVLLLEEAVKTQNGDLLALFMLKGADPNLKPSASSGCQTLAECMDKLEWQDPTLKEDLKNWLVSGNQVPDQENLDDTSKITEQAPKSKKESFEEWIVKMDKRLSNLESFRDGLKKSS